MATTTKSRNHFSLITNISQILFRKKETWVDKNDLGNRAFNDAMTLDQVRNDSTFGYN